MVRVLGYSIEWMDTEMNNFVFNKLCVCVLGRFQASSDAEKMDWVEKLNNAILMGLNMAPEEKPGKRVKAEVRETYST